MKYYSILNIIHSNQWKLRTLEFVWPLVWLLMDLILFCQNIIKLQVETIPAYGLLSWYGNCESYMHKQTKIWSGHSIYEYPDGFLSFNKNYMAHIVFMFSKEIKGYIWSPRQSQAFKAEKTKMLYNNYFLQFSWLFSGLYHSSST